MSTVSRGRRRVDAWRLLLLSVPVISGLVAGGRRTNPALLRLNASR
jgi:hypothetical protein